MIPYLASIGWCGEYLRGESPEPLRRHWNRTLIATDEMLTIPVQGGITAIKRTDPLTWQADDTRTWRHQHIGAINARLGRTPFYHHYASPVIDVLADTAVSSIAEISAAIYALMAEQLQAAYFLEQYQASTPAIRRRLKDYAEAIGGERADRSVSLLNYLCRFGPDTIFILTFPLL